MTTVAILIVAVLAGASMTVWGLGSILVKGFSSRKRGLMLLIVGLIVVVNSALYVRDHYGGNSPVQSAQLQEHGTVDRAKSLDRPERICRLLVDYGFTPEVQPETGKIWGQVTPMYYSCRANASVTVDETPVRLSYQVQSDDGQRVDLVRLHVDVTKQEEAAALAEFKRLAGILFDRLPTPMPDGFHTAIDDRNFRPFHRADGTVELLRDRREQGYRLRMEIRPDPRKS
jgi:hypothetical protein